jgi:lipopolysaccharide/colanic/teichoic acid biosynthesis glycosyltransferase
MEVQKKQVLDVVYIGKDSKFKEKLVLEKSFNVATYDNGLIAIKQLKELKDIDGILCDPNLPGMSAFNIYEHMQREKLLHKRPFIVVDNHLDPKVREKVISTAVDDYYVQPVVLKDLKKRLEFLKEYNDKYSQQKSKEAEGFKKYKIPFIKRLFDIVVAGTALLVASPFLLLIILAIRLESKGKVYYFSKRVGSGYKVFNFYKLRSMYPDADKRLKEFAHLNQYAKKEEKEIKQTDNQKDEALIITDNGLKTESQIISEKKQAVDDIFASKKESEDREQMNALKSNISNDTLNVDNPNLIKDGGIVAESDEKKRRQEKRDQAFVKLKNDPRITKVGKFIRNTSIDEIPQLINVLKGDMSIVGNRPLPLYEAEHLTTDDWGDRFKGPAGITGLWQVKLRGKGGDMSVEERKKLDNEYANTYSFWKDIILILQTIPALFQKDSV